jgi:hypothetical protein
MIIGEGFGSAGLCAAGAQAPSRIRRNSKVPDPPSLMGKDIQTDFSETNMSEVYAERAQL